MPLSREEVEDFVGSHFRKAQDLIDLGIADDKNSTIYKQTLDGLGDLVLSFAGDLVSYVIKHEDVQKSFTIPDPTIAPFITATPYPLFWVDSTEYPNGIEIKELRLSLNATATLSLPVKYYAAATGSSPVTIDTLVVAAASSDAISYGLGICNPVAEADSKNDEFVVPGDYTSNYPGAKVFDAIKEDGSSDSFTVSSSSYNGGDDLTTIEVTSNMTDNSSNRYVTLETTGAKIVPANKIIMIEPPAVSVPFLHVEVIFRRI